MRCLDCGPLDYGEILEDPDTGAPSCGLCGATDVLLDLIEAEADEPTEDQSCPTCGAPCCSAGEDCDGIPY